MAKIYVKNTWIDEVLAAAEKYNITQNSANVTVTIASPAVFSWTAHGLHAGDPIVFGTSGSLPTGLTPGALYYVIAAGLTANAFEVSTIPGGTAVVTSGSQSGVHTAYSWLSKIVLALAVGITTPGSALTAGWMNNLENGVDGLDTKLASLDAMGALYSTMIPGGRLTLSTGVPIPAADVTGASTIYYTPFNHNGIVLWDGTRWVNIVFTEKSISLSGMTTGLLYDVFAYLNSGVLAIEKLAWTSATARATAVTQQDGRDCKSGDKTRLYLGTFEATAATTTEDSDANRLVQNRYNRVPRRLFMAKSNSHSYNVAAFRQWNADASFKVTFVCGLIGDNWDMNIVGSVAASVAGQPGVIGLGLDVTNAGMQALSGFYNAAAAQIRGGNAISTGMLAIGHHYVAAIELGNTNAVTFADAVIIGFVMA